MLDDNDNDTYAHRLRAALAQHDIKACRLALGVSRQSVHAWLSGASVPGPRCAAMLDALYRVGIPEARPVGRPAWRSRSLLPRRRQADALGVSAQGAASD